MKEKVTISSRNGNGYTRFAIREEVKLSSEKSSYIKHNYRPYVKIDELKNSKGEKIGIDLIEVREKEEIVIQNINKGLTIVIIKNSKGEEFKGVSKCHKDDFFKPQTGYTIAKSKAEIKRCESILESYK